MSNNWYGAEFRRNQTVHDGKSDIQRELESQGFAIHTTSKRGIPQQVCVTRGDYRSKKTESWQKLQEQVRADNQTGESDNEGE